MRSVLQTVGPRNAGPWFLLFGACAVMAWLHISWFPAGMPMLPLMGLTMAGLMLVGLQYWHAALLGLIVGVFLHEPEIPAAQAAVTVIETFVSALAGTGAAMLLRLPLRREMLTRQLALLIAICVAAVLLHRLLRFTILVSWGQAIPPWPTIAESTMRTALGVLLWVPLALSWFAQPMSQPRWKTALHFCLMMVLVTASAALVNLSPYGGIFRWSVMPPLVWAALAFGARGVTAAMMVVVGFTIYGNGVRPVPLYGSLAVQGWTTEISLAVLAGTMLLLARLARKSRQSAILEEAARDLTARKVQLQSFIKDAPVAIAVFDRDMLYLAHSQRFLDLFHLHSHGDIVGRSHYDLFPELSESIRMLHRRALDGEEASGEEDPFEVAPGKFEYLRWKLKPWRDETGAIAGLILTCEIVTAAVEARRFVDEAKARYRAVFDQTQVGIARSTLARKFFEVNEPAAAVAGLSRGEMLSLGPQDITHPDDWPKVDSAAREMLAGRRQVFEQEERIITADGRIRWIHLNLSLVRSTSGEPMEFVSIVQDITARLEAKQELQAAQDQLIRVSRLSAMGAMASTLAHELNQPLAAISNFSAAARSMLTKSETLDRASLAAMMDSTARQALRAGDVIRRMRDFAVNGHLDLKSEPLAALILAARDTLHARRAHADVEVVLDEKDGPLSVLADRVQLEQVIGNLLLNAAEATEGQARRKISVSCWREDDMVVAAFQDNGPGILPDVAATLFEPFRTTKVRGTGLGLPICRIIIDAHQGNIWLDNSKRPGALFMMRLRCADLSTNAANTDAEGPAPQRTPAVEAR